MSSSIAPLVSAIQSDICAESNQALVKLLRAAAEQYFSLSEGAAFRIVFADGSHVNFSKSTGAFSCSQDKETGPQRRDIAPLSQVIKDTVRDLGLSSAGRRALLNYACLAGTAYILRYSTGDLSYTFADGSNVLLCANEHAEYTNSEGVTL